MKMRQHASKLGKAVILWFIIIRYLILGRVWDQCVILKIELVHNTDFWALMPKVPVFWLITINWNGGEDEHLFSVSSRRSAEQRRKGLEAFWRSLKTGENKRTASLQQAVSIDLAKKYKKKHSRDMYIYVSGCRYAALHLSHCSNSYDIRGRWKFSNSYHIISFSTIMVFFILTCKLFYSFLLRIPERGKGRKWTCQKKQISKYSSLQEGDPCQEKWRTRERRKGQNERKERNTEDGRAKEKI